MSIKRECLMFAGAACVTLLALAAAACERSDPTAPADSTITVSANPQTIVVPSVGPGEADITATLRSKNGTTLPDQEVTFSTTSGSLDPNAETSILTNNRGQATCKLSTRTTATVTARSGLISGTTQVQTTTCDLDNFGLDVQPQSLEHCADTLTLTAAILDVDGVPCGGVRVIFTQDPDDLLTGTFSPSSKISDAAGLAVVTWKASQSLCESKCTDLGDPNGTGDCGFLHFMAGDITGTFDSAVVPVKDDIP